MISRLVLIRHAKAENRKADVPDIERKLTKVGRRSIRARFPLTMHLLSDLNSDDLRIWSSPAHRALQTADVVAETLGISNVETHDVLYPGDIDEFVTELAEATGTVVVVGHNPYIEELYLKVGGERQHFDKGAVASFAFDVSAEDVLESTADLEWFVQGPQVQRWKTIVCLERALDKAGERIEKRADMLLADPQDPEVLHQYRISIRVARSLVRFAQPYIKRGDCREVLSGLKSLQDPTSRLRELDMLVTSLTPYTVEYDACNGLCQQAREDFNITFAKRSTQKNLHKITKQLRELPFRASIEEQGVGEDELSARVQTMREDYEWEMSELDFNDQEAVHDVRKSAKEMRYVTRELSDVFSEDAVHVNEQAKLVQDRLGELCDCRTNARLVVEICGADAVSVAARFIMRADEIVAELDAVRK